MYVAALGRWEESSHGWARVDSWQGGLEWLRRYGDPALYAGRLPPAGHLYSEEVAVALVDGRGLPVYGGGGREPDPRLRPGRDVPRLKFGQGDPVVAVLGNPRAELYSWDRLDDWAAALDWLGRCETCRAGAKILKPFPSAHLLPEPLALLVRHPDGSPHYPPSSYGRHQSVILN